MLYPGCLPLIFIFGSLMLLVITILNVGLSYRLAPPIPGGGIGLASIGGAGTFDGIVLSGLIAAFLA